MLGITGIDYRWLFEHVAGIVHHGGAGTTTTGLASATPSTVVPFVFDQVHHGRRLAELGVGPGPVPVKRVSPDSLADVFSGMVRGASAARYRDRAGEVAAAVREEDGLGRALDLLLG